MIATILLSVTLFACSNESQNYDIVTTMYTQYSLTKQIVGDKLTVDMLVPLGEGIHDFEPTSQDMVKIENAKLFLYTSKHIDAWITDETSIGGNDTLVVNLEEEIEGEHNHVTKSSNVILLSEHNHDHETDAHFWIDPENAILIADVIKDHVIEIDPDNADFYEANFELVHDELETITDAFITYLSTYETLPTLYVAGHNAFELFADHFELPMVSIFDEFQPDSDLTSNELISFINDIISTESHGLFLEAMEEPKAANQIKSELENSYDYTLTLYTLSAYQNVYEEDFNNLITYAELMERNIETIKLYLEG